MFNNTGGFYLKKLEILNWGTFDGEIETFHFDKDLVVITGNNGSGKSTLVDAIITLLVPNNTRKYNLSSGDQKGKSSRNELSYIKGVYGKESVGSKGEMKSKNLRDSNNDYSIISGYFYDDNSKKGINLIIFFTINNNGNNDGVNHIYITSEKEQFLQKDYIDVINNLGSKEKLKGYLRSLENLNMHDTFIKYKETYSDFFGIKSNAINVFNKVVSLKQISNLDEFFRDFMLDQDFGVNNELNNVLKYYNTVKNIYNELLLSEKKFKFLEPLKKDDNKIIENQNKLNSVIKIKKNLKYYLSYYENNILLNIKKEINGEIEKQNNKIKENEGKIINLESSISSNQDLLKNNDLSKIREQKRNDREIIISEKNNKNNNLIEYNKLLKYIGIIDSDIKNNFLNSNEIYEYLNRNNNLIKIKNSENEGKIKNLENENLNLGIQIKKINEDIILIEKTLDYLNKNKNAIPFDLVNARKIICKDLGINENEIPFVCELIKIKDSEKKWEIAIEKLLNSFGKKMLVSSNIIGKINNIVNNNNLKTYLKYEKIDNNLNKEREILKNGNNNEIFEENLFSKIEFKDHIFIDWIKEQIYKNYNYICLKDSGEKKYYDYGKVLTMNGLIKNNGSYSKDDRVFINKFILGWDNQERIEESEKELKENVVLLNKLNNELNKNIELIKELKVGEHKIWELNNFNFEKINYLSFEERLKSIEEYLNELNNSNFNGLEISDKIIELNKEKIEINLIIKKIYKDIGGKEENLKEINKYIDINNENLKEINNLDEIINSIKDTKYDINNSGYTYEEFKNLKNNVNLLIEKDKNILDKDIEVLKNKLNDKIENYKNNFLDDGEKIELKKDLNYEENLNFIRGEMKKINEEKLYECEKEFDKNFKNDLLTKLKEFWLILENNENIIKFKIEEINKNLKEIVYGKSVNGNETYISIDVNENVDNNNEIGVFKKDFIEKVKDIKFDDVNKDKIRVFQNISKLIEDIIGKSDESKYDLIDVRNWVSFVVREKEIFNDEQVEDYKGNDGKSGGQTIKLAYSILSTAILYQYGIKESNIGLLENSENKSFKLVVIDEFFAKLDKERSDYVLKLFQKLGLQLFIVTPPDGVERVRDFNSNVYLIQNKNGKKSFARKIDINIVD